jgi:Domain of unknown function (DUF5666)
MSNHEECESTMIRATTRRTSAGRNWRRWTPALAGLGIALAATACGGAGTAATPPAASTSGGGSSSSSPAPTSGQAAFPGVIGTAAAVSGSSMEVQNPTSGQVTVTFTNSTAITETVAVTSKDVTVGSCVAVVGPRSASGAAATSVTATSVTVSSPVNGTCTAAGFGGFGGFGGGRGTFTPNPSFSARPRPSGSRGAFGGGFGGANGTVISVSASGFVVRGRNPAGGTDTSVTVTTSAATKYLKVVSAHPSALKVGQCITAIGTTNSIGAVAARSIRISQPGPNGCVTGFGRRGGFGGGSGGTGANA